jgi:hypothetical protein
MESQAPNQSDVPNLLSTDVGNAEQASSDRAGHQQHLDARSPEEPNDWSRAKAISFRIAFIYFVLYALPFPFGYLPGTDAVVRVYERIWHALVPWVAQHVLKIGSEISLAETGSGDKAYDWVLTFCYLVLAIVAGLIWSALRRSRGTPLKWIPRPGPWC